MLIDGSFDGGTEASVVVIRDDMCFASCKRFTLVLLWFNFSCKM
jgi:hypothetical protein